MENMKTRNLPLDMADTTKMSREDWLRMRKTGIGGSDAGVCLGMGLFRSPYELYVDKTNPELIEGDEPKNWFTLDYGNALEPLVLKWYGKVSGYSVVSDKHMYRHAVHQFMLADLDGVATTPEGEMLGVEVKTTAELNVNRGEWIPGVLGQGGKMPYQYEVQVRHYMAVMDLDRFVVLCCYGNSESNILAVQVLRDYGFEAQLIRAEADFWFNHVLAGNPPEDKKVSPEMLKSIQKDTFDKEAVAEPVELSLDFAPLTEDFFKKEKEIKEVKAALKALEEQKAAVTAEIVMKMGGLPQGIIPNGEDSFIEITNKAGGRTTVDSEKLKTNFPEIYELVKKVSETYTTTVKVKEKKKPKVKKGGAENG